MKFFIKILFFYFLFHNVLCEDLLNSNTTTSSAFAGLFENNIPLNGTNNATFNALNSTTPVLFNCTNGVNTTDLSQCTPINITTSFECTNVNYDFLIYSTSWQPRLCHAGSKDCKVNDQPKWRIEGLRGAFTNGTRPVQCCSDKQLKINELNAIMSDLKEKWSYDQYSTVDENVIEDWNLHGSCVQESEQKSSIQVYSAAIELSNRLPIEQWLNNARIEPSNDKRYALQFFNYSISSKLDKRFQMRCKTYDYEKKISIIDTINICVERQTSRIIDCPADFDSNCLDMVYYPINLLDVKVPEEIIYRDMNYYRYNNYHRSYSPFMYGGGGGYGSPYGGGGGYYGGGGNSGLLTGVAIGGAGTAAALALPAAYYYFKTQNKMNKYKYGMGGAAPYPGGGGGFGATPWYSSSSFANTFAPSPSYYNNHNGGGYGTPKNFGNLGTNNNLYPKQSYPSTGFLPPTVYSGIQNNKNFGGINPPPSYNSPSYPSYSNNKNSGLNPSYPPYSNNNNKPSYPAYPSSNLPQAPPPYSVNKNSPYPKQASPFDSPPSYSSIDKNKPSYPAYTNSAAKPSAPSFTELNDKSRGSSNLYPKLPSSDTHSGKYSPSAPSYPPYPSSGNKPSYPAYPSSNSKPISTSNSKPKSSGGFFGKIFGSSSGRSSGSSSGRNSGSRSSGGRSSGGRSRG